MKLCEKCGNQNNNGHCYMDIYNELGQTKGPSVTGNVLLVFGMPALIFIGSMVLSEYLLSAYIPEGNLKTIFTFLSALVITFVFVRLILIKNTKKNVHKSTTETAN